MDAFWTAVSEEYDAVTQFRNPSIRYAGGGNKSAIRILRSEEKEG